MNFIEYFSNSGAPLYPPYQLFLKDMNFDGQFTITDCWEWVKHAFFFFGDTIQYGIYKYFPLLAQFFEIGWDSYHGLVSGIIGVIFWTIIITIISVLGE